MELNSQQQRARQRAALIVQVQSGVITAQEAATQLGVSRKTYYKWEKRALAAMLRALTERPGGRPGTATDPEKQALSEQTRQLQEQLQALEQTLAIREALAALDEKKDVP